MVKLRIGFMGTPDFAVPPLRALYEGGHNVVCVYSQPPRPKGRGQKVQPSPVHEFAQERGIPVFTPVSLKDRAAQDEFAAHKLDVAVVAAYGLILPQAVLDAPVYGCLNIHASLLPRWRGASPIQQAIWAGDDKTGVSIMQMERGLDTGPVIATRSVPISADTNASSLHDELAALGAKMIMDTIKRLAAGGAGAKNRLLSTPQNEAEVTYAPLLSKDDGRIDWGKRASEIDRQIRALNPWPGVWAEFQGARVKILEAGISDQTHKELPGTIFDRAGSAACGGGTTIRLTKIQPAGAKAMDFAAALNGGYVQTGNEFS